VCLLFDSVVNIRGALSFRCSPDVLVALQTSCMFLTTLMHPYKHAFPGQFSSCVCWRSSTDAVLDASASGGADAQVASALPDIWYGIWHVVS
jgi:hypothetical protein